MTESKFKPASDGNNVLSDFQKRAIENGRAQNQSEQNENGSTSELEEVTITHSEVFFEIYEEAPSTVKSPADNVQLPLEVFTSETSNKNEVGSINKEIPDQSEGNDHEKLMQRLLDASETEPERHSLLFRHYKNKFYRFLSLAKHSETLEEFVVYESCYQNDESKYWIRPRNMFFEKIEFNGELVPRFDNQNLRLRWVEDFSEDEIQTLKYLSELSLGHWNDRGFRTRLAQSQKSFLVLGFIGHEPIGFKFGYQLDEKCFLSTMSGVIPKMRGFGFAQQMAQAQKEWAKAHSFEKIRIILKQNQTEMLRMNLNMGFQIKSLETEASNIVPDLVLECLL